jgi:hypothetical protein
MSLAVFSDTGAGAAGGVSKRFSVIGSAAGSDAANSKGRARRADFIRD